MDLFAHICSKFIILKLLDRTVWKNIKWCIRCCRHNNLVLNFHVFIFTFSLLSFYKICENKVDIRKAQHGCKDI